MQSSIGLLCCVLPLTIALCACCPLMQATVCARLGLKCIIYMGAKVSERRGGWGVLREGGERGAGQAAWASSAFTFVGAKV